MMQKLFYRLFKKITTFNITTASNNTIDIRVNEILITFHLLASMIKVGIHYAALLLVQLVDVHFNIIGNRVNERDRKLQLCGQLIPLGLFG